MPSIKPKLQGYLEPEIHSAFLNWQEERGYDSISVALNTLLSEYFGFNKVGVTERGEFYGIEQIKEIIQKEVSSKLPSIPEINQRIEIHCQEWMNRKSEDWMFKLGEQFLNKIHLLEQEIQQLKEVVKPIEELADISHPLPESAEESPQDFPQSPLEENVVALASSAYSSKNLPKKGDIVENNFGKAGQIIKIWPENPKYEIQWDGLALPKRHDLADLEVLGVRRVEQPVPLAGMKQNQLEQRLDVKPGTLSRRRSKADFKEWSREHDPDAIAWQWDAVARRYLAVE